MASLSPERWQQIDALFDAALDQPTAQRLAFLRTACGDDNALFQHVQRLLEGEAEAEAALGESAATFAAPLMPDLADTLPPPDAAPPRIGPYQVQRELGRGGMGVVYLAERDDAFHKQVALKVIKRGLDTDDVLRRFRYERQVLARLEHPHIARLLDGGTTDDGRPYFVLEYVDGQPITTYCDAHTLGIDARLRLFEAICDAVQYAHQNLTVHRDLKPSNILVTADGEVKLLDFGIAKVLTEEPALDLTTPLTQAEQRVLTPAYASPEQLAGAPVTTASDVYSLGVVLYELLTGRRPHQASATLPRRPSTVVSETHTVQRRDGTTETLSAEVLSASRATTVDHLRRRLRGDLDTILMMALHPEATGRYASADAFLADIKRHLDGLPVVARPNTFGYRARKFVRRHKAGVATVAAVAALIVGFAVTVTLQQQETARERDRAEAVATLLQDLFNASDPFLNATSERLDTLQLRAFLDLGAAKIQRTTSGDPSLQASMLGILGGVYRNLGLYDTARSMHGQALAIQRDQLGAVHPDIATTLEQLGIVLEAQGDYDAAEANLREALTMRRQTDGAAALPIASVLTALANVRRSQNAFDEAKQLLEQALAIQLDHLGPDHGDMGTTYVQLGRVHQDRGDLVAAEDALSTALTIRQAALGDDHLDVATSMLSLSSVLRQQRRADEAQPLIEEALALRERVLGAEHPLSLSATYELAGLARNLGDYERSIELTRYLIDMDRQVLGPTHPYIGNNLIELAITQSQMQAHTDAVATYVEALAFLRTHHPEQHLDISSALTGLGFNHMLAGDAQTGEPFLREALALRQETLGSDSWRTGVAMSALGECLMAQGRHAEAEPLLVEGYDVLVAAKGPTGSALRRLIALYEQTGRPDEAARYKALAES